MARDLQGHDRFDDHLATRVDGACCGPEANRPAQLRALSGALVYGVSGVRDDGCVEVALGDGTRVRVHPKEIAE